MLRLSRSPALLLFAGALALGGCAEDDPAPIGSNCDKAEGCVASEPQSLEQIDEVDILLVVDNSGSIDPKLASLKDQLPEMLNAIVNGGDGAFPPAASVHVAVVSSDMGTGAISDIDKCSELGDDGIFVRPADRELTCETSYPGYLAFDGEPAAVATVDTVACVPLLGSEGCGFEQPLEASLKAVWPASDDQVTFADGTGHGEHENAGFLRDDSLLVVVVVSDEDDCSTGDPLLLQPSTFLDPNDPEQAELMMQGLNVRCGLNPDRLHSVERYADGLKALHADHPERIIFAVIGGFEPELLAENAEALASDDEAIRLAGFDAVLDDASMQFVVDSRGTDEPGDDTMRPSCMNENGLAYAPIRLAQTAREFGTQGVLGSLCSDDFGDTTGMLIRAIGERLNAAANGGNED